MHNDVFARFCIKNGFKAEQICLIFAVNHIKLE